MKNKALFLDRDGIINIDKKYVHKKQDFEFCVGIFEFCKFFIDKGYLLFVITNQSGIARGYYGEKEFESLSEFMLEEFAKKGIKFAKIYHCPHLEDCECRKPKPGMLLKAKTEFELDMANSFFIGDNLSDMKAGLNAKVGNLALISENENLNLSESQLKKNDFLSFKNLEQALEFYQKALV